MQRSKERSRRPSRRLPRGVDERQLLARDHPRAPERPRVVQVWLADVRRHRHRERDVRSDAWQHRQLPALQLDSDLAAWKAEEHVADQEDRVVPSGCDRPDGGVAQRRELATDEPGRMRPVHRLRGLPRRRHGSPVPIVARTSSPARSHRAGGDRLGRVLSAHDHHLLRTSLLGPAVVRRLTAPWGRSTGATMGAHVARALLPPSDERARTPVGRALAGPARASEALRAAL